MDYIRQPSKQKKGEKRNTKLSRGRSIYRSSDSTERRKLSKRFRSFVDLVEHFRGRFVAKVNEPWSVSFSSLYGETQRRTIQTRVHMTNKWLLIKFPLFSFFSSFKLPRSRTTIWDLACYRRSGVLFYRVSFLSLLFTITDNGTYLVTSMGNLLIYHSPRFDAAKWQTKKQIIAREINARTMADRCATVLLYCRKCKKLCIKSLNCGSRRSWFTACVSAVSTKFGQGK